MGDSPADSFGKFVPGFDFLQNLAKGATQSMPQIPNLASWVTPSMHVEDIEKRIGELRAVHFWLEQNSRALGATIQALEVQKMTLATLKGMNFSMGDMAKAFTFKAPQPDSDDAQKRADATAARTASKESDDAAAQESAGAQVSDKASPAPSVSGLIDPMQLWGALTQQFQQIAAGALQGATRNTAAVASAGTPRKKAVSRTGKTGKKVTGADKSARKSSGRGTH